MQHLTTRLDDAAFVIPLKVERNYLFDAMRGLAAIMVVIYHVTERFGQEVAPRGYLAVDFFFILSGYFIARVYEKRLVAGTTFWKFLSARLIRLYPAYFAGFALGMLWLISRHFAKGSPDIKFVTIVGLFNGLMLPAPSGINEMFPSNYPAWSLFAELVINIVYAAGLFRLGSRNLIVLVVVCALVTIIQAVETGEGLRIGFTFQTIGIGLVRTVAAFGIGVLISRHPPRAVAPWFAAPSLAALLVALLLARTGPALRPLADIVCAYVAFPTLLWIGAVASVPHAAERIGAWLGEMSYPLYTLHAPALIIAGGVGGGLHLPKAAILVMTFVLIATITTVYTRWMDRPARRWLGSVLQVQPSSDPKPNPPKSADLPVTIIEPSSEATVLPRSS